MPDANSRDLQPFKHFVCGGLTGAAVTMAVVAVAVVAVDENQADLASLRPFELDHTLLAALFNWLLINGRTLHRPLHRARVGVRQCQLRRRRIEVAIVR